MNNGVLMGVVACIAAIIIPIATVTVVAEMVEALKPRWYHAVPVMRRSALSAGLLLPAAILWATPGGEVYAPDRIFSIDGPWNLGFLEMLETRWAPYLQQVPAVYLHAYDAPFWVRAVISLHALLILAAVLLPFRVWPPVEAARAVLCGLLIFVTAAFVALYVVCASYWLLHQFSFWIVAALGLLFQRFRLHREHRARGH